MIRRARSESAPGPPDLLDGPFSESHSETSRRREAAGHAHCSLAERRIYRRRIECTRLSTRLWWGKVRKRALDVDLRRWGWGGG